MSALRCGPLLCVALLCPTLLGGCSPAGRSGANAAPSTFGPSDEAIDGKRWLEETASAGERAGAGPLQILAVGPGTPGDHVPGLVNVPAGLCALLYARGSRSVDDIDLFVYGDDGAQFGSDEAPDSVPTLLVCPDTGRRLYVAARVAAGQGIVALGVQQVEPKNAESVARASGARNYGSQSLAKADMWPGLVEGLEAHRRAVGGTWEDVRRVALPVDARVATRLTARIPEGRCLDAFVVPSDEVAQIDVEVLDADGRIFARSASGGTDRAVIVCSPEAANVTYEVRPHAGRGLAVLALSTTASGTESSLSAEAPRFDLMPLGGAEQARRRESARLASRRAPAPQTVFDGAARVGSRTSTDLTLGPGCSRLDVWSKGDLLGIEAHVWSPEGRLLARQTGISRAPLFVCSERARLDVEATRRKGAFSVEQRRDPEAPAVLGRQGLAASRLLSRMREADALAMPREVGQVREVKLQESSIERSPLALDAGACADVYLALGAGGSGAEVRVLDTKTGLELALSRGADTAHARVCAAEGSPVRASVELRAARGAAVGLFVARVPSAAEPPPAASPKISEASR